MSPYHNYFLLLLLTIDILLNKVLYTILLYYYSHHIRLSTYKNIQLSEDDVEIQRTTDDNVTEGIVKCTKIKQGGNSRNSDIETLLVRGSEVQK